MEQPGNMLWVDFVLIPNQTYSEVLLELFMKNAFASLPDINNILLCVSPGSVFKSPLFTKLTPSNKQHVGIFMYPYIIGFI